jgi:hypothetical protein
MPMTWRRVAVFGVAVVAVVLLGAALAVVSRRRPVERP